MIAVVGEVVAAQTAREERGGDGGRPCVSMGVDTKANTSRGGGALEVGDLRLLEDGSERNGALGSDAVVQETAREGWGQ